MGKIEVARKKDVLLDEKKKEIQDVIKNLIASEGLQNPEKELTIPRLQSWMDKYPDKFFRLQDARGLLNTYFYGSIKNLKFTLGIITDYE